MADECTIEQKIIYEPNSMKIIGIEMSERDLLYLDDCFDDSQSQPMRKTKHVTSCLLASILFGFLVFRSYSF